MAGELHRDRARAAFFGAIAEEYDRLRPSAPAALLDDLAALKPERVLDIGCGTGKVARGLIERGLSVLGVEPDARMAEVARRHGVEVEVAAFEDWDARGRTFDLITCGDAWHWIDPDRGWRKIGRVLAPGGTVARFWNRHELDEPLQSALDAVYARLAPGVVHPAPWARDENDVRAQTSAYAWDCTYSADEWVALMATHSAHQVLEPARLAALLDELRAAITAHGPTVLAHRTTLVSRSRAMPR